MPKTKRTRSPDRIAEAADGTGPSSSKRNKTGGRPVRSSAGKKSRPQGYVDSSEIFEYDSQTADETASNDDEERRPWSTRKQRISPIRDLPAEDFSVENSLLDLVDASSAVGSVVPPEVNLTFNVPPGHSGAFVVKLDLGSMLSKWAGTSLGSTSIIDSSTSPTSNPNTSIPSHASADTNPRKIGFLSLPAELRNTVYCQAFVTAEGVNLRAAFGFCRSAALLATCKQIHQEGTQILYGENKFELLNNTRLRGAYYDKEWKEVGYKDCLRFLFTIGPKNISYIRDLSIVFEDGCVPFVDDDDLMQCLKLLAKHSRLATLKLGVHGKKQVKGGEIRFIHNLTSIKADSVEMTQNNRRLYGSGWQTKQKRANVFGNLDTEWIQKMQRKIKIRTDVPISVPAKKRALAKRKPKAICSSCRLEIIGMECRHYECFLRSLCKKCLNAFSGEDSD